MTLPLRYSVKLLMKLQKPTNKNGRQIRLPLLIYNRKCTTGVDALIVRKVIGDFLI